MTFPLFAFWFGPSADDDTPERTRHVQRAHAMPEGHEGSARSRDEQTLIRRLQQGDLIAFDELHRTLWPGLVASAFRYIHDKDAARDVVQDVFMHVWDRRATWDPRGAVAPYFFGAVRNRAISVARHRRLAEAWAAQPAAVASSQIPSPPEALELAELVSALRRRLAELPERCRETFLLYRQGTLGVAGVARVMGVSAETVKTQIKRAVAALRDVYRAHQE